MSIASWSSDQFIHLGGVLCGSLGGRKGPKHITRWDFGTRRLGGPIRLFHSTFGSLRWKQNPRWCLSSFQFMWDSLLLPIALQGFADTLATLASMIEITEGL
jgi:hypothetical protein